jgi:hypothetical protein
MEDGRLARPGCRAALRGRDALGDSRQDAGATKFGGKTEIPRYTV